MDRQQCGILCNTPSSVNSGMHYIRDDFLGYLREWECRVGQRVGFSGKGKEKMLLPKRLVLELKLATG